MSMKDEASHFESFLKLVGVDIFNDMIWRDYNVDFAETASKKLGFLLKTLNPPSWSLGSVRAVTYYLACCSVTMRATLRSSQYLKLLSCSIRRR